MADKLDLVSNIDVQRSLASGAKTDGTANGTGVSLEGYNSAVCVFVTDTVTDGTHIPGIDVSDDGGSSWAAADAADIEGSVATLATDTIRELGYKGSSAMIRPTLVTTGSTTGAVTGAVVIRGHAQHAPAGVANAGRIKIA